MAEEKIIEPAKTEVEGGGADPAKIEPEMVTKERLDSAVNDIHKHKNSAKEWESKYKTLSDANLQKNQEWQKLYEQEKTRADTADAAKTQIQDAYLIDRKRTVVRDEAVKLGLRPEAVNDLTLLDLNEVQIQTTSDGQVNILGADTFAKKQMAQRPHWFGKKDPTVPVTGHVGIVGQTDTTVVTAGMLAKAERKGYNTGDQSEYLSLYQRYQEQRKAKVS